MFSAFSTLNVMSSKLLCRCNKKWQLFSLIVFVHEYRRHCRSIWRLHSSVNRRWCLEAHEHKTYGCRCFKMLLVKCSTSHRCSALQPLLPKSLNFWKWLPHEEGHSGGEITSFRPWSLGKFLWWKRGCWMIVSSQINSPLLQPVAHVIYTHSCHGNRALWHLPNPLCFISGDCREQSEKSR